jgi:hypothetical protein
MQLWSAGPKKNAHPGPYLHSPVNAIAGSEVVSADSWCLGTEAATAPSIPRLGALPVPSARMEHRQAPLDAPARTVKQ